MPALDLSDKLHPELKVHLSDENLTPVSQKLKIEENDSEYRQLNETPTVKNIHKVESKPGKNNRPAGFKDYQALLEAPSSNQSSSHARRLSQPPP